MAPDKTFGPDNIMTFVGFEINTIEEFVCLPADKVAKCKAEIAQPLGAKKVTLRRLQSVIGLLNFACAVVKPGRPFLRRLIDLTINVRSPFFFIRVTREAKQDLALWDCFLKFFNGRSLFVDQVIFSTHELGLFTDASGSIGYGAVWGNEWFQGLWSSWWVKQNITLLELYPIVVAIEIWGSQLMNRRVVLHTDNLALVSVLHKQTSKEPLVMVLVRRLVLQCLKCNLVLTARHIPGLENKAADALSRFQMARFHELVPTANSGPTPTPPLPLQL